MNHPMNDRASSRFPHAAADRSLASLVLDRVRSDGWPAAAAAPVRLAAIDLGRTRVELLLSEQDGRVSLLLGPRGQGAAADASSGPFAVSLDAPLVARLRGLAQSPEARRIEFARPGSAAIAGLVEALRHAGGENDAVPKLYAQSIVLMIAARLLSDDRRSEGGDRRSVCPLPKWRLKRVDAYVDAHFGRRVTLEELAAVAGLSPMYFAAQFRAARGMSPHDYLLARRIEHTKERMSTSADRLIEIALEAGFQTQAHFTTVFRRLTGTTPRRWRDKEALRRRAA